MNNLSDRSCKRSYHPLVIFFFYSGMLDKEQLAQIPPTTIQYWKACDHQSLYGYSWVEEFYLHHKLPRYKAVHKTIRVCCRILDCFAFMFSQVKGYKKILKKNADRVINTVDYLRNEISLKKACKIFSITSQQYYRLKNKIYCSASVSNLCFKSHPSQLSIHEVTTIKDIISKPENLFKPLCSLYYELLRTAQLSISLTSFYKYAALLLERTKENKIKNFNRFRASKIFEYIHIDITHISTEKQGNRKIAFVKDNKSKAILNKAILPDGKSNFIRDLLKETFEKYNLCKYSERIHIVSDGGPENKGEVIKWIKSLKRSNILKLTAKKDFKHSNNMSESLHHIFKNEYLAVRKIQDNADLSRELELFDSYYNWKRYPIELYGYAPMEVLNGAIPDRNRFKEQIQKGKEQRYLDNKSFTFCTGCK